MIGFLGGVILIGSLFLWGFVRPFWLTRFYGPELEQAVERFFTLIYSVEGNTNPDVVDTVATGQDLEYHMKFLCRDCPSVPVVTEVQAKTLWVLEYSDTTSKAAFRIEWGMQYVDPKSKAVQITCRATAHTKVLILKKEQGVWKVETGADEFGFDRNPVEDSPELHAKYCQE